MPTASLSAVLRQVYGLAERSERQLLPDRQLLEQFVARRDEAAFAVLVGRHGGMVLGVAQRILHDTHAAEDVFQNTFLTLARSAGSIRKRDSVASWLYGVAARLASQSRMRDTRRTARERATARPREGDTTEAAAWRELGAVLDEELQGLPEKYRTPLVLIYFVGQTQEAAARQLGCNKGTMRRRLERGKRLLHGRLLRRGVALSVALLASGLSQTASEAALPPLLVQKTIQEAIRAAANPPALWAAGISSLTRTKILLGIGLLIAGTSLAALQITSPPQPEGQNKTAKSAVEERKQPRVDYLGDPLPEGALTRFGTMRFRQGNGIYGLALSPDDRLLVTVGGNNVLHLWDVATGKEVRHFPEEQRSSFTYAAGFSPDGKTFATGGFFGFSLWRTETGEKLHFVETGNVYSLTFAPDGKTLGVGCATKGPSLWDVASGKQIVSLEERAARPNSGHIRVGLRSLAFSPDGRLLASTYANSVILWDVAARQEIRRLEGHKDSVHSVAFSPDGKLLASGGKDRTVRLWDAAIGRELRQFEGHQGVVTSLVFTPNGKTLVSGSGDPREGRSKERHVLRLWDVASGEERGAVGEHDGGDTAVTLSRDGTLIISTDGGAVRFWDLAARREVRQRGGHQHWIGGMAFSPDGKRVATGGGDRTVRLWDAAMGRELRTLATCEAGVDSVAFSPNGRLLAFSSRDGVIHLWDASCGQEIRTIRGHEVQALWVAFSPDGTQLVSASRDATAALWDVATGKELQRFKGNHEGFRCVAFSPDGKRIAAGEIVDKLSNPDGPFPLVRVWDVTTGQQIHALRGHKDIMISCVAFSPDGGTLLASTGWDKTTRIWDMTTGEQRGQLPAGEEAVAFSPDGRTLATGSFDKIVRLWETATLQQRGQFWGHGAFIHALAFAPDGRTLLSGSMDTTALLWDLRGRNGQSPVKLTAAEREKRWQALADSDAARAFRAVNELTDDPQPTVSLLAERIHAVRVPDPQLLARCLADLDSERFEVRERATKQIETIGELAKPALQKALEGKPSLEVRRRIEQLLTNLEPIHSPEQRRTLRAIEVLEHIGSPEARRVLETMAAGAADARLTREAKVALRRLNHQP